ncbi:ABC transporter ATP-binding protein [Mesorhizobium sp. CAU 1741]|uniref:ABC transporter ATP-binding protein n=1 Tax=Mesorhizobium sp. CAU 1741 TaxID=3140366 RepID=UPI00325B2896
MSELVLQAHGLGKAFRRYRRELDRVAGWFGAPIAPAEERWVLRDISFAVEAGQSIGIVGRNGAGKSTLLKMIAGTMRPNAGTVSLSGRVAAILELGMGFNPELTGRQNVYHSGGMMGLQRSEISGLMDWIAGFAELGDHFDQPLRIYSSGMQMRLAFAVATAMRPDVLIIDEALAVGDSYFQHKSMERIRSFREQGTALILVSHDKASVQSLCDRALLLDEGRLALDGTPESVLDYYNALLARKEGEAIETHMLDDGRIQTISGSRQAQVERIALLDAAGRPVDTVGVNAPVTLRVEVLVHEDIPRLVLGFSIKSRLGQTIFGTNSHFLGKPLDNVRKGERATFEVGLPAAFVPGSYSVSTALVSGESHIEQSYEWRDLALMFSVVNVGEPPFDGISYLPVDLRVKRG